MNTMSLQVCDSTTVSQLFAAVKQNDRRQLMELVLSSHCDPRFVVNDKKETLLHIAAQLGFIDMVRTLVEIYQLCPFKLDQFSVSSFEFACQFNHLEVVAYFVGVGGHTYICKDQPCIKLLPHLILAAASSKSVVMTRFACITLHFNQYVDIKLNLFHDSLRVIDKIVDPKNDLNKSSAYFYFIGAHCCNNLELLKFFCDELMKCISPNTTVTCLKNTLSLVDSFLNSAYRLDNAGIVSYLTRRWGISSLRECPIPFDSTVNIQPFDHKCSFSSTLLYTAIQSGSVSVVREIITQSGSFYRNVASHGSFLHSACVSGRVEMVELILQELDLKINAQNDCGSTPLHVACEWGWTNIVLYLLDQKQCNPNVLSFSGHSSISLSIRHGRLEIFKFLLTRCSPETLNATTLDTNETLLHIACCSLCPEYALALLDDRRYTCSLDAVDKYGDTALFNACRLGSYEIVQKLIQSPGCTPLMVNHITNETPAHIACRHNRLDLLTLLLTEGVDVPLKCTHLNFLGESLLHVACANDNQEILDFLIDSKVCTEFDADASESPLLIACSRGNVEAVKKLLNSGICKITDKNSNKDTVLHCICRREVIDPQVIDVICEDLNAMNMMVEMKNNKEKNPLHYLFENEGSQILHYLSKHLNLEKMNLAMCSTDNIGDTPLHVMVKLPYKRTFTMLKYLLNTSDFANGISRALFVKNSEEGTPLQILCRKKCLNLAERFFRCQHLPTEILYKVIAYTSTMRLGFAGKSNLLHFVFKLYTISSMESGQYLELCSFLKAFLQRFNEKEIVSLLSFKNDSLETPLHCSIISHQVPSLQYTNNVEHHTVEEFFPKMISWLIDCPLTTESIKMMCSITSSYGNTLIHTAVRRQLFETVKVLVEKQLCDPLKVNDDDSTPLHEAFKLLEDDDESDTLLEIALYLCEHGCSAHALDKYGCSPVVYAIKNGCFKVLKQFRSKGYIEMTQTIEVVTPDCIGRESYFLKSKQELTPIGLPLLHSALFNECHRSVINSIITEDQDILQVLDQFGNTVLHWYTSYNLLSYNEVVFPDDVLNQQNKEGNTPLHVACATGNKYAVKQLIESEKCSRSLSLKNVDGHTPLYYTSDRELVNLLVMNGADPSDVSDSSRVKHITDKFEKAKETHPLNQTVTALVLGNSMAGKTTLIKSLTKAFNWESLSTPSIGQVNDRCERTAGIEISEYKPLTKGSPRILFYDFAGHPEFHGTHSVLLQNLMSFSKFSESDVALVLFVIVVDITDPDKLKQLRYWAKFIEMCFSSITVYPDVVVIGSHLDKCQEYIGTDKCRQIDKYRQIRDSLNKTISDVSPTVRCDEYPILLNCRDQEQENLRRLEMLLKKSTKNLERYAEMDERCHLVFSFLYEHFPNKPVNFSELKHTLSKHEETDHLVFTRNNLIELLKIMHSMQHILLIGDVDNEETHDFWILTAKAQSVIFKDIHGVLFAGEDFDTNMCGNMESNVGVISSAKLREIFPDVDYEMLPKFLVYSELCKKIDDKEVLQLIKSGSIESDVDQKMDTDLESTNVHGDITEVSTTTDQSIATDKDADNQDVIDYFFFPSLVKETKSVVWKHDKEKFSHSSGWCLKCVDNNFFSAMFLQVLLLRLTFQFAATTMPGNTLHRKCVIWKNGLFWSSQGVEMLVQVIDQNQVVLVLVRCLKKSEMKAVELRSAVLKEVLNVKRKHCQSCKTIEYVIRDPNLDDSGLMKEPVNMIAMHNLASALHYDTPYVEDTNSQYHLIEQELLYFEPYACVGKEMLKDLFDPDKASKSLKKEELRDKTQSKQFHQLVDELEEPAAYHSVRLLFDRYSVFYGRDPKVRFNYVYNDIMYILRNCT